MDYSLFGHQIVCHEVKGYNAASIHNAVDGDPVPVPHFGLALTTEQFHNLADRVRQAGLDFVLEPHLRFEGEYVFHHLKSHGNMQSCSVSLTLQDLANAFALVCREAWRAMDNVFQGPQWECSGV